MDSVHHRILSAAEDNNFEVIDVSTSTNPQFYENPLSLGTTDELDSTAEDCSTGIAFAPAEFSGPSQVEIADLSNASFSSGSPGSWEAPEQFQTLTGSNLSSGSSGSAVAQGTHTGVITGEFGSEDSSGNADSLTALALPSSSDGNALPAFTNWVTCHTGPDPSGKPFVIGDDPHTLTSYQSPNGGDAIALLVNEDATEMVQVDLTKMLDPGTVPAAGNVCSNGTLPASVERFFSLP
jgi:hypothetical protein